MQSNNYDPEFEKLVAHLFNAEGGYSNHLADKGGETKYGINKKNYPTLDIKNLTKEQAKKIYHDNYYQPVKALGIKDPRATAAYFDLAANSGLKKATGFYKQFGDNYDSLMQGRKNYYANIIQKDPSQRIFEQGWNNRLKNLDRQVNSLFPQPQKLSPNQQKQLEEQQKKAAEEHRHEVQQKMSDQAARARAMSVFGEGTQITSGHRDKNHPLSKKNPHSAHIGFDTVDLAWDGKSKREHYIAQMAAKGLQEGRDYKLLYEVGDQRSPWATGDHIHLEWLKPAENSLAKFRQEQEKKQQETLVAQNQPQELPMLHNVKDIITDWNFGKPKQEEKPTQPDPREIEKEFIKQQADLAKYQQQIQQQEINRQKNEMLQKQQQHEQQQYEMAKQQADMQTKQLFDLAGSKIANLGKNPYAEDAQA